MNPLKESMCNVHASAELKRKTLESVMQKSKQKEYHMEYQAENGIKSGNDSGRKCENNKGVGNSGKRPYRNKENGKTGIVYFAAGAAASLLICFTASYGIHFYQIEKTPAAYISMDVNPSIELTLNKNRRIIGIRACNEDGESVLSCTDPTGSTCEDAIDDLISCEEQQGYLTEDSNLTFTIYCEDKDMETVLAQLLQNCQSVTDHEGTVLCTEENHIEEAHDCDLSFGKYEAYLTLHEYDDTVTPESCHNMTMKELNDLICSHENAECEDEDHSTSESECSESECSDSECSDSDHSSGSDCNDSDHSSGSDCSDSDHSSGSDCSDSNHSSSESGCSTTKSSDTSSSGSSSCSTTKSSTSSGSSSSHHSEESHYSEGHCDD